ncbi:MAG TPA: ABC transporter ATP-binding protein [Pyrinomonadaceae bacterium]|jgi:lipoprotein-releasing system ATP-binding protein|nr:ABC transporter ATP-binding protein [Pyrinomonadaceae bacterium]
MPGGALVVEDVWKSFRNPAGGVLEVLRGVTFAAAWGEMLAVVGASGAGKSTLLHVLGGLEAADAGRVRLGEFDITRAAVAEQSRFRNASVGFVFQFHHLLPDLTAAENVALPLLVARRSNAEARGAAQAMLERVGLRERAAHRTGEMSGGEQQRVAIARALVGEPRLVLADEPTGNLDARTGEEVGALLLSLCRARPACVVIATHNEQLARTCDRRLLIKDGRVGED